MCRKHVKTRADQTEKHTFSRSRYTAFSRSRAAEGFGSETQQGGFHGKDPSETMVEFRDVGTPACTRQTE